MLLVTYAYMYPMLQDQLGDTQNYFASPSSFYHRPNIASRPAFTSPSPNLEPSTE
jgi:hypothetical protein